jgi:hypothetical protein
MNFLLINDQEISALRGLPYLQQVIYLLGIKPYMDRQTAIVGVKRRISYQSLAETAYIEPHQGIQSGSPSRDQLRRVVKSLARVGLIEVQSDDKHLVLKCLLATSDYSVQNKAATNPPPQAATKPSQNTPIKSGPREVIHTKADIGENAKAAIPHISENNNICFVLLREKFEKFWECYPQPQNQPHAWREFQKINPDEALFSKILAGLNAQINHYQQQESKGLWVPNWKYPANWLAQRCWEDENNTNTLQEQGNANHPSRVTKQPVDFFWESCKGGVDYVPDYEDIAEPSENVIQFGEYRKT